MKTFFKYITAACLGIISLSSCNEDNDDIQLNPNDFVNPTITTTATTAELSEDTQNAVAFTFDWTDASFGVASPIKYDIEVTTAEGQFDEATILTSTTETTFDITGAELNAFVVEKLGLAENEEATIKYRIAAFLGTYGGANKLYSEPKTITLTPYSTSRETPWGLVGSATPNGWNGPDVKFWKTSTAGVLETYAYLAPDATGGIEFKIRKNNEWVEDFGGNIMSTTASSFEGTLVAGGSNITVPQAGHYHIKINLNEMTFSAEKYEFGITGDATPNSWDGPDAQLLTYDSANDVWIANNVTFTDGMIKFRVNNAWDINFGGSNGTLAPGGDNIQVTAGTYNIVLDLQNLAYSIIPAQ